MARLKRFGIRLTRDPELAGYMMADMERGVNLSHLIKELLKAYYRGELNTFNQPGGPMATEVIDQRVLEARNRFKKVSFDKLGE